MQKTAWLAKKKAISARAVSRRRDRAGMDEVRDDNTILADIGVEPMNVTDDADWETAAHANLEECMEEC